MLSAAVVPHGQAARQPFDPAAETGVHNVTIQVVKQGLTFRRGHIVEPECIGGVDPERFPPGDRMPAHDRMTHRFRFFGFVGDRHVFHVIFEGRVRAVRSGSAVDGSQGSQCRLHALR